MIGLTSASELIVRHTAGSTDALLVLTRLAGGSLREPASKQGLFALRPSWDALPMEGVFPLAV